MQSILHFYHLFIHLMDRVFDKLKELGGLDLVHFRNFLDFFIHLFYQN